MRGQTHSSTFRLPTFIRSQRNLVRESKKRRGDTKSNSEIPTQTGSELGCLGLRPKACDESTLRGLRPRNGVGGSRQFNANRADQSCAILGVQARKRTQMPSSSPDPFSC